MFRKISLALLMVLSLATVAFAEVQPPPLTECWYPVVGCLRAAEDAFLGNDARWGSTNPEDVVHRPFIKNVYLPSRNDVIVGEMDTVASRDHTVVNRFLRDHGFEGIELHPFGDEGFGTAAILKVAVEWLKPGEITKIQYRNTDYPAAHIEAGVEVRRLTLAPGYAVDVVVLETKGDDIVYLTPRASFYKMLESDSPLRLTDIGVTILSMIEDADVNYGAMGAIVPMVDLSETIELEWMLGMAAKTANGDIYRVDQAVQQTKFMLDEVGARVESAAAIGMSKSISIPYVLDEPFIAIVARKGMNLPILVADVGPVFWKRPKRK